MNPSESSFYFNHATIIWKTDAAKAAVLMEKCLQIEQEEDEDHLSLAYKVFAKTNNPQTDDIFQRLEKINPYLAFMAKREVSSQSN